MDIKYHYLHGMLRFTAMIALILANSMIANATADDCGCSEMRVGVKSNLIHDALLTPDLGIEVRLPKKFSIDAEGVYAWWSKEQAHHTWRIYGGWIEGRFWFGKQARHRALTGHHVGIYGSLHSFDFEFGENKGWQCPGLAWGAGVAYGYSFRIADRLNLDLGLRVGYMRGDIVKYKAECGTHVCTGRERLSYFGPTGLEITLVWFPGRNDGNNPKLPNL